MKQAIPRVSHDCPDCGCAVEQNDKHPSLAWCPICDERVFTVPLEQRLATIESGLDSFLRRLRAVERRAR